MHHKYALQLLQLDQDIVAYAAPAIMPHSSSFSSGNVAVAGTLANVGQHDWIAVSLSANQAYEVTVNGLTSQAQVTVRTASGTDDAVGASAALIGSFSGANDYAYFMPSSSGTYYVDIADPYADTPENYILSVAAVTADFTDNASTAGLVIAGGGVQMADVGTTIEPFSKLNITDLSGQDETVTVTPSNPNNGVFSNLGGGTYDATTGVYTANGDAAEVTTALDNLSFTPTVSETASGQSAVTSFQISVIDSGGASAQDTSVTVEAAPCFASGTRIHSDHGEVPVEALHERDRVVLARGRTAPVIWLGHRHVDCRRHSKPHEVWPVRVAVDAFGAKQPRRDLWLSPDHAVFTNGVLIPIRYLVNGATIVQEPADEVTYWHVELPQHDVLLAEGLPCESYLDTGNRGAFENGSGPTMLHPDFAMQVWEKASCAELVLSGARLYAARSHVHERALALGFTLTSDPDLHLLIGGRRVDPRLVAGGLHRFSLPAGIGEVHIVSRASIPAETDILGKDTRRLGVMLDQLILRRPSGQRCEISLGELPAGAGFYALEVEGTRCWRWTDGHACLALPSGYADGGRTVLDLHVVAAQLSWPARPSTVRRRTA
jgi:hypothetical protein